MPKKLLSPDQARGWLARRYGNQHRSWLATQGEWPLSVNLGTPTEKDFSEDMAGVRAWVDSWTKWNDGGRVVWEERKWGRLGAQRLPTTLQLESAFDVATAAGQGARWATAAGRYSQLAALWPDLVQRTAFARHFDVLADYDDEDFTRLVSMVCWLHANPSSGKFTRQVPVSGLDTKWLERRKSLVMDFLRLVRGLAEAGDFHTFCGLQRAPHRMRIRVLCSELRRHVGGLRDVEAPLEELATLPFVPKSALIVENLETGVALPDMPGTVAVMKLGHGVSMLSALPWLQRCHSVYWGDLDTHGLAILDRARQVLPALRSVLMDEETLMASRPLWGYEPTQHPDADLSHLTTTERSVFEGLKRNTWGTNVRLEQERLPWKFAIEAVQNAFAS